MNQDKKEHSRLFFIELRKIHQHETWEKEEKIRALAVLMELLFTEITRPENIQFTTLFARIAYASHKFGLDKKTQYWIHFFRKKQRDGNYGTEINNIYLLGLKVVADSITHSFGHPCPEEIKNFLPKSYPYVRSEQKVVEFRKQARVTAIADDAANDRLVAVDEGLDAEKVYVQYGIAERNEPFSASILQIRYSFGFPLILSLTDIEIVETGGSETEPVFTYRPRAIVIEPDYLIDVTAIANCFSGSVAEPMLYLLSKFMPNEQSIPMLMGNIANHFLDELMLNPKADFKEMFAGVFKLNPLGISLLNDKEIRDLMGQAQKHWVSLYTAVHRDMAKENIPPKDCFLEPSFYDSSHGLQGRLDVLYLNQKQSAIIELKSGSAFMPNQHGIGASHFIQTLLYDLMVRSTYGENVEPSNYILYSREDNNQLRYAPLIKSQQNEALQIRNQMVTIERQLCSIESTSGKVSLLEGLTVNRFPGLKGFSRQNLELFESVYSGLSDLERTYFNAYCGFIAREHRLAKTGIQGLKNVNGLASIWLDTNEEKENNYEILSKLVIHHNKANESEPILVFQKSAETNQLANFRVGDIAVLYPLVENESSENEGISPIKTQLFKVTILDISPEEVTAQLRYKQFNLSIFKEHRFWNLEHDQMDMSFSSMYQGLFRFAQSESNRRDLLLTSRPPAIPDVQQEVDSPAWSGVTVEQKRILSKMIHAKDYFLLWGPPGTGKTSRMLKHFAGWIYRNSSENLLLLAYTNRAVDEICEALESLDEEVSHSYLRIGSYYSCGERFRTKLLSSKMETVRTRSELRSILDKHRIFVSTLASFSGNLSLLQLKTFKRVVIDEASQILEPSLIGLLPNFEQFILIGDHKQLPAVVVQSQDESAVLNDGLKAIGLTNLRNSLFERLYKRCSEMNWHWAFDHLSHQGRMHADIMLFSKMHFYENKLDILPSCLGGTRQKEPLFFPFTKLDTEVEKLLSSKRMVFLHSGNEESGLSWKTNRKEANLVSHAVRFLQERYRQAGRSATIGVITPYRAQIALIAEIMQKDGIDVDDITIDTVERYQGGARDLIVISLCINDLRQLESLVSLSDEGVDRKLNVALTRAKEQIVMIGNEDVLSQNQLYRTLIAHCKS